MEYRSTRKRDEIFIPAMIWKESQKAYGVKKARSQKWGTNYMIPFTEHSRKSRLTYSDGRSLGKVGGVGRDERKEFLQKDMKTFQGEDVLLIWMVTRVLWMCVYLETYQIVHFKGVQFPEYQLYFNRAGKNISMG